MAEGVTCLTHHRQKVATMQSLPFFDSPLGRGCMPTLLRLTIANPPNVVVFYLACALGTGGGASLDTVVWDILPWGILQGGQGNPTEGRERTETPGVVCFYLFTHVPFLFCRLLVGGTTSFRFVVLIGKNVLSIPSLCMQRAPARVRTSRDIGFLHYPSDQPRHPASIPVLSCLGRWGSAS
ncbi:hypothetical protein LZ31DRAFT_49200 [Colletotrichum somersetense]|nr:hypothetical protein LZ31DRAFT_49200 [Colletotrichum somersetense]